MCKLRLNTTLTAMADNKKLFLSIVSNESNFDHR